MLTNSQKYKVLYMQIQATDILYDKPQRCEPEVLGVCCRLMNR